MVLTYVDLVIRANLNGGHEVGLDQAPEVITEVLPGEHGTADEDDGGDVEVEVDAEISLQTAGNDPESGEEELEDGKVRGGRGRRSTEVPVVASIASAGCCCCRSHVGSYPNGRGTDSVGGEGGRGCVCGAVGYPGKEEILGV